MKYKVWIQSILGMYEQYSGNIEVSASTEKEAIENAYTNHRQGIYTDRNRGMWKVERVECIGV